MYLYIICNIIYKYVLKLYLIKEFRLFSLHLYIMYVIYFPLIFFLKIKSEISIQARNRDFLKKLYLKLASSLQLLKYFHWIELAFALRML